MNRKCLSALASFMALGAMASVAPVAYATMNYDKFSVTVPKVNGDAYTGSQKKVQADAPAELRHVSVGGNYGVDACVVGKDSSICLVSPWKRLKGKDVSQSIPNAAGETSSVRIRFSNDVKTLVNVAVKGEWRAR